MPIPKSLKAAQTEYKKRNLKKGLMRVNVWVPVDDAEELKFIAQEMRVEYKQAKQADNATT